MYRKTTVQTPSGSNKATTSITAQLIRRNVKTFGTRRRMFITKLPCLRGSRSAQMYVVPVRLHMYMLYVVI